MNGGFWLVTLSKFETTVTCWLTSGADVGSFVAGSGDGRAVFADDKAEMAVLQARVPTKRTANKRAAGKCNENFFIYSSSFKDLRIPMYGLHGLL